MDVASTLQNAICLESGLHRNPSLQANSSSYAQSKVPLMIRSVPSVVSCVIFPDARSSTYKLCLLTYATFLLSGEIFANINEDDGNPFPICLPLPSERSKYQ